MDGLTCRTSPWSGRNFKGAHPLEGMVPPVGQVHGLEEMAKGSHPLEWLVPPVGPVHALEEVVKGAHPWTSGLDGPTCRASPWLRVLTPGMAGSTCRASPWLRVPTLWTGWSHLSGQSMVKVTHPLHWMVPTVRPVHGLQEILNGPPPGMDGPTCRARPWLKDKGANPLDWMVPPVGPVHG